MKSYALSHQGNYRTANEDAYLLQDGLQLYIVADGIGSMQESSVASDLIVKPFTLDYSRQNFADRFQAVQWELMRRHHFLYEQSQGVRNTMGATIAALLIMDGKAGVLSAGDSRIYAYVPLLDQCVQLTEDDVYGRAITRAVGVERELVLHRKVLQLEGGEKFLLCTDGLHKKVLDDEIHFMLKHQDSFVTCKKLIDLSLQREVKDNITVMVVENELVA